VPLGDTDIKSLISRNEKLKSVRAAYESDWNDVAKFIVPIRVKTSPGSKKTQGLFDSTAIDANKKLAASMHGTLTPSNYMWSSFKLRDHSLNKIKEVMDWIEICQERIWLARCQSNYRGAIHELYIDYPAFGQGCLFIEEKSLEVPGFNGFLYRCFPNYQYCTTENAEGIVDTIFREDKLSARAAIKKWGEQAVGEKISAVFEKEPDREFDFLHCVYPSESKGGKPWDSHYIALDEKVHVAENGYYEFPYIVPRWSKVSGEHYGSGPGHDALPDIRSLNKAREFGLKSWAKDLDPATFETDGGVIGTLRMAPGSRNVARGKEHIWTLDRKARHDVTTVNQEDLRRSIKQIFYSDQLNLPEKSDMREMEVAVRYELMQRLLGPSIGRFESEGLNPQIEREFGMMMRASSGRFPALPPPPDILLRMGINEIDIEYEGPLAQAEKMNKANSMKRFFAVGAEIANFKPDVMDVVDIDEGYRLLGEIEGVPSRIMRSEEEIAAIREQRAKAQAEEQTKVDLERMAMGVKNVAPALKALQGGKA